MSFTFMLHRHTLHLESEEKYAALSNEYQTTRASLDLQIERLRIANQNIDALDAKCKTLEWEKSDAKKLFMAKISTLETCLDATIGERNEWQRQALMLQESLHVAQSTHQKDYDEHIDALQRKIDQGKAALDAAHADARKDAVAFTEQVATMQQNIDALEQDHQHVSASLFNLTQSSAHELSKKELVIQDLKDRNDALESKLQAKSKEFKAELAFRTKAEQKLQDALIDCKICLSRQ